MVYVLGREVLEELLGVKEEVFLAACALALGERSSSVAWWMPAGPRPPVVEDAVWLCSVCVRNATWVACVEEQAGGKKR